MGANEPAGRTYFHVLPVVDFDEIASGGGSSEAIRRLWSGEYSRRLILLKALLDLASAQPELLGPLPSAEEAWSALERMEVEAASAPVLREVLLHPQVGVWMSYTLRAIRTGGDGPLWPEIGCVHSLAFAVAVRTGLRAETKLPTRHGCIVLPTLGLVRLPHARAESVVSATTANGVTSFRLDGVEVELPRDLTSDTENWWSLRRLRAGTGINKLDLTFDDIDPFRDLADPVPPRRLSEVAFQEWADLLQKAWRILNTCMPSAAPAIGEGLRSLAPLPGETNGVTRSASTGDGFGAVLTTRPHDSVDMAVTLVHEFQHTKLGGLLHLDDLFDDAGSTDFYAPWRDDPRPFGALFQGAYAFFGICAFWRSRYHLTADRMDQFEFAYARRQTWKALRSLVAAGKAKGLGERFLHGMVSTLQPWMAEPLPVLVAANSWYAIVDHETAWRIRNLRPDPLEVNRLAESWLTGHALPAPPEAPEPIASTEARPGHRFALFRLHAGAPTRFAALLASNRQDADINLVGGDTGIAADSYLARLRRDIDDDQAWSGLALAATKHNGDMPWRALLRRPELVKAVCREVNDRLFQVDPLSIARCCERFTVASDRRRSRP